MKKTILITGSTDGIGFATARSLLKLGHAVLIHGRNEAKLADAKKALTTLSGDAIIDTFKADLSSMKEVQNLIVNIKKKYQKLDVLINNAGVFKTSETLSKEGLDIRFVVNTIAPYLLATKLLPLLSDTGRVINLSSAAQAPLDPEELTKPSRLSDSAVYAKSKLALTMWSRHLGLSLGDKAPVVVAVNPKSLLGSKMVKEAYGIAGGDLQLGADILVKAALSDEFAQAQGLYFDNDNGQFSAPYRDALDPLKTAKVSQTIEKIISQHT